jgi:exodeoxyribonuclease-5
VAASPNKAPYFILKGFAGTGKTHLMKMMADAEIDKTIYFTAPTNKATKVLRSMLGRPCKTIYSLLGLKMSSDTEVQELVWPDRMPELSYGCIIVVDEAGMCNKELVKFIGAARTHFNAKIMYVGDPAQLLPVGEDRSPCWSATMEKAYRAMLKKVMRFDNQLLRLATHLRECVRSGERPVIESDNDGNEGVFKLSERKFLKELLKPGAVPEDYVDTKVIAWRNRTVNEYNDTIREHLGFSDAVYKPRDLLMVAKPIEVGGTVIATIDEDLMVETVKEATVYLKGYEIPVYEMLVRVDGGPVLKLNVPTEDDLVLQTLLNELAEKAKRAHKEKRGPLWKEFWQANNKFHRVRYGYAMTAHRAQGSTVRRVFVDFNDIMSNRDKETAHRCAYVAFTRPTQSAYTF